MVFISWLAKIIARETAQETIQLLQIEFEGLRKIEAISLEARDLIKELDAAQSESERKSILRKLSNFSDASRTILN